MATCDRLVKSWIATQSDVTLSQLVQGIENDEFSLLAIIKCLGDTLTSDEGSLRGRGVALLSNVLTKCPQEKLDRQATRVLTTFYCSKLDDTDTIVPGLDGILSLASLPTFISSDAVSTFRILVKHVRMRALGQSTRYTVYKILDLLVARHREDLKRLGSEFLQGYISLVEGEKDPRNLLLAFSIHRVILIEFDVQKHVEDLHDIVFCYFPITFKPPPNDPYGISTDELRISLRGCLAATPLFGPLGVPLLLEKLSATSASIKRDTLQAMAVCIPVYGSAIILKFAETIWNALKVEIFQPIDGETEALALKVVQSLVLTVSDSDKDNTEGIGRDICLQCNNILAEPEKNQAQHAIKVLSILMLTTRSLTKLTTSKAVSQLLNLYRLPDEASHRTHIVRHLASLMETVRKIYEDVDSSRRYRDEQILDDTKDQLLGVFTSGLKAPDTRQSALDGIHQFVRIPGLLSSEEVSYVVNEIDELLDTLEGLEDLRKYVLHVISTISKINPAVIEQTTLPFLFSGLPDVAPTDKSQRAVYQRNLRCLSTICIQPALFETLAIRLSTKLDLLCSELVRLEQSTMDSEFRRHTEYNAAYSHAILVALDDALKEKAVSNDADIPKYVSHLVPRIFAFFAVVNRSSLPAFNDARLVPVASSIVSIIVRSLSESQQGSFLAKLTPAFLSNDFSALDGGQTYSLTLTRNESNGASTRWDIVPLFASSLCPLRRQVTIPVVDLSAFLDGLLRWGIDSAHPADLAMNAFSIVATVINKRTDDLFLFMENIFLFVWEIVKSQSMGIESRRRALEAWTQLTRAMIVRAHPQGQRNVEKLLGLLGDPSMGWDAAKALGELAKQDKVLCKQNYAVVKILYMQKYTSMILPHIILGARTSEDPYQKSAFLIALSCLMKHLPRSIYAPNMPTLMPLFILGLDLPDVTMRANVLAALLAVTKEDDAPREQLSDHASTLVKKLAENVVDCTPSSKTLRISALKCLGVLPTAVPYNVLHPHRQFVLRQLAKAVDDPKREVRRVAVDTRDVWFALRG